MLIRCISISGTDVPEHQRFSGESRETTYAPLIVGNEYYVFGVIFYVNRVDYLVSHADSAPIWVPSCLFSVVDSKIDSGFYAAEINKDNEFEWLFTHYGARFIIGYREITESFQHFVGVLERTPEDLLIFETMKASKRE